MSWSVGFSKPVLKKDVGKALDELEPSFSEPPGYDQFQAAKEAAKLLAKSVPGPYVNVTLSGHANGIGWQKKEGWSNDCINISVTQQTEDDLKYYNK